MNLNVIRTLTMRSKVEGAEESKAALKGVQSAYEGVAKVTETSAKGQLSLADAVSKAERRFNTSLRAQQDFEKVQRQMNLAVAQNPALQERANAVLALARTHFDQASKGSQAYGAALQAASAQASMFASRMGPLGGVLTAIGPAGLVAAAGIGVLVLGIHQAVQAANDLADKAGKMVDFAETTGLTTTQLQALQKAAAFVGIDADKLGTNFERFTAQLEELRRGTGGLFDGLNRLNPALTRQLAETRSAGEAWDVFSKAIASANREQGVALSRAAFGRGGAGMVRLAGATTEAGGTAGLEASLGQINTLTTEQLKHWDDLKDKIDYTTKIAKQNVVSIFTEPVLQSQLRFTEGLLSMSQAAKNFSVSGDWDRFISDLNSSGLQKFLALAGSLPLIGTIANLTRIATSGAGSTNPDATAASFNDRFGAAGGSLKADDPNRMDRFNAANLQRQVAAMGEAASAADKLRLAEMQLTLAGKEAGLSQEQLGRALAVLQQSSDVQQLQTRIGLLGVMASVEERVAATAGAVSLARLKGVQISDDEARSIINLTRAMAEANTVEARMIDARKALFQSPVEQSIDRVLMRNGIPPESERGKAIADYMRMTEVLRGMNDALGDAASGFAKDMFNGASGMEAAANAAQRLRDILIDVLAKKLATAALSSFVGEGLGATTGAATSATILTTAGTTLATSMIAGATTAAGILTGAGAVAGTSVAAGGTTGGVAVAAGGAQGGVAAAAGGVAGGTGLAAGGMAAALAIYGPIALLLAAVAAAASVLMGSSKKKAEQEAQWRAMEEQMTLIAGFDRRRQLASIDTSTKEGARLAFEIGIQAERIEAEKKGRAVLAAFDAASAAEHLALRQDWAKRELEIEKQKQDDIVRIAEALADRVRSFSDRVFAATNDNSTLAGALVEFEHVANQQRIDEFAAGGQAINELIAAQEAERLGIYKRFGDEAVRQAEEAARQAEAVAKAFAQRTQGIADRMFELGTDPTTLEGQLAAMQRRQQREVISEQEAGGELLLDLSRLHYQEELRLRDDFNKKALDETKRAKQEELEVMNRFGLSVVNYLSGLQTGAGSALPPSGRLSAAQSAFNTTHGLALNNNPAGRDRWVQDAEALRTAAQAMFGSAAGYQAILTQINQRGLALPAVATSTDPIVSELAKVIAAVNATKGAVDLTKGAVNLTTNAVDDTTLAVDDTTLDQQRISAHQNAVYFEGMSGYLASISFNMAMALGVLQQALVEQRAITVYSAIGVELQRSANAAISAASTAAAEAAIGTQRNDAGLLALAQADAERLAAADKVARDAKIARYNAAVIEFVGYMLQTGQPIFGAGLGGGPSPTTYGLEASFRSGVRQGFAEGGMAPPNSNIMFGEHHPQGPFFGRTGSQPLAITPNMPTNVIPFPAGNDNSRLERVIERQTQIIGGLLSRIVALEEQGNDKIDENTQATINQTDGLNREVRFSDRKKRAA